MLYHGWEVRRQFEHEHTRLLSTMMVNTSMGVKKAIKPQSLYSLPEIDGVPKVTTKEELEAFRQRLSKRLNREIHFLKVAP
ncbi:hypothetical protein ACD591_16360 [Rufibacter glacialis]|nr:hypothetical protein [Rufibacter glacialis]GGK58955.1 hypothetical protein GCM10011405_03760 [Rufibacter glacialis]